VGLNKCGTGQVISTASTLHRWHRGAKTPIGQELAMLLPEVGFEQLHIGTHGATLWRKMDGRVVVPGSPWPRGYGHSHGIRRSVASIPT